jgi:hypothetical protein
LVVKLKIDSETVPEQSVESLAAGVEWAAIAAGALAAVGVSIILFGLGSGLGVAGAHPPRRTLRASRSLPVFGWS